MKPLRNKTPSRNTIPKSRMVPKDPVQVFCRIRPSDTAQDLVCLKLLGNNTVQLLPPEFVLPRNGTQRENNALGLEYTFRHVFDDKSSQDDVFGRCALPLVEDLIRGKNGLIFTYGVTSSGKTYTMTGTPKGSGLLPRSFDVLFNSINAYQANKYVFKPDRLNGYELCSSADAMLEMQREIVMATPKTPKQKRRQNMAEWGARDTDPTVVSGVDPDSAYSVFVSYIEIYNNHIFDLLEDVSLDQIGKSQSKILRTDAKNNMYVFGATEIEVKSADEAFEVFWKGQLRRSVAHTALNTESSRSHSVFTLRLVQAPLDPRGVEVVQDKSYIGVSQLSLVDLAGSERTHRTRNTGNRLKEAGNINNSLMVLRQCIEIMREKQNNPQMSAKMIPYRDNKLTLLFKSFFEGEGRVRMVVCAHPGVDEYDETLQVMKFAEITQEVMISRPVEQTPKQQYTRGRRDMYLAEKTNPRVSLSYPYNLGPLFPNLDCVQYVDSEQLLSNLEECLTARDGKRSEMRIILSDGQTQIRSSLADVQKENQESKPQLTAIRMDLEAREHQLKNVERRLASTEQSNDALRKKVAEHELRKRTMQHQLTEKDYQVHQGKAEMAKIANEMEDRLESERERMKQVMEHRLAIKQAEVERKMCMTQEKFGMLREILNAGDWALPENLGLPGYYSNSTKPSEASDPKFSTPARPTEPKRLMERGRRLVVDKQSGIPSSRGVPAANPRHRRSQSADVWIDHKPAGSVDTGTLLQPTYKKRKSVTRLDERNITKEGDKYVLTHQEQDSEGDVETQLFKGNIIPSAGGGAQVIFNDVEVLRQTSPPSAQCHYSLRKRSADGLSKSEIEARCKIALEGKPPITAKKPRN